MPEYDAFGRPTGELEELGWTSGTNVEESIVPQRAQARDVLAESPTAGARLTRRRSRGPFGCVLALVVAVGLIGGVVFAVVGFVGDVADEINDVEFPAITQPATPGGIDGDGVTVPDAPERPPVGVRRGSLVLRANFARALRTLRGKELGSIHSLRVAPERIDAQLKTSGGRLRNVQIRWSGEFQQFSVSGPGFGHLRTVPFSKVDRAAPFRLVARAARRLGRGADGIDYLVLSAPLGTQQWGAYFKSGATFLGSSRGSITRRIG